MWFEAWNLQREQKDYTKKWRQLWQVVVCRCSVPSVISSDHMTAFAEMLSLTLRKACIWFQFACFLFVLGLFVFFQLHILWSCTLHLVWREGKMSQILVFNNASAIFKIMQNVSTLQEFTACCLSRLDGRYTMTFNWSKKEIKMFTQCYSNLTEKRHKGALFYVLAIVLVCFTWKVWLYTSWEGGAV